MPGLLRVAILAWTGIGLGGVGMPAPSPAAGAGKLYLFVTPAAPDGDEAATRALRFVREHEGKVALRTVLLIEHFADLRGVTDKSPLTLTLRALGDPGTYSIPLYDLEGLALARAWEIREVPAFVLVVRNRAHRVRGSRPNLADLWECTQ